MKTSKKSIPAEIKKQVQAIVQEFNKKEIGDSNSFYVPRYRGSYLYLDRSDYGRVGSICRLQYTGSLDTWEFAIFKYSDGRYDPEEWLFPGDRHLDGTVQGALRAGMEAYP